MKESALGQIRIISIFEHVPIQFKLREKGQIPKTSREPSEALNTPDRSKAVAFEYPHIENRFIFNGEAGII